MKAAINQYLGIGLAQGGLGSAVAPAAGAVGASGTPSSSPPASMGAQFFNGAGSGFVNEFKDQWNGLVQAGQAIRDNPFGPAESFVSWEINPDGQLQKLVQQAASNTDDLFDNYQIAARSGSLPHFFGDLAGHGAAQGADALATDGAGKLLTG